MKQTERSMIFIPGKKRLKQIDSVFIYKWKHRYSSYRFHVVAERSCVVDDQVRMNVPQIHPSISPDVGKKISQLAGTNMIDMMYGNTGGIEFQLNRIEQES